MAFGDTGPYEKTSWAHEKGVPGKVAQLTRHAKVDTTLNVYTPVIDGSLVEIPVDETTATNFDHRDYLPLKKRPHADYLLTLAFMSMSTFVACSVPPMSRYVTRTLSPTPTASVALIGAPFAFVPSPLPTNFVVLSIVKVKSFPPAAATVNELPARAFTVLLAFIGFAFAWASTTMTGPAHSVAIASANIIKRFMLLTSR
jgi:hypothetical protein